MRKENSKKPLGADGKLKLDPTQTKCGGSTQTKIRRKEKKAEGLRPVLPKL